MTTAILCAGVLGLLVFGLGFGVSMQRGRTGTNYGATPDPADALYKWQRAHGNAAEYCPMLAVLILFLGSGDPATWVVGAMLVATASRVLHAIGLIVGRTMDAVQPLRFLGALGTYLAGFALCIATFGSLE